MTEAELQDKKQTCKACGIENEKLIGLRCRKCVSAYSLKHYHNNKQKRGIKSHIPKSKEEIDESRRKYERDVYKKNKLEEGKSVRLKRGHGTVSKEMIKAENLLSCKKYRENNLEKKRESAREWGKRNRLQMSKYLKNRYKTNEQYNMTTIS